MKNLHDYFEPKPFKDQTRVEQYSHRHHRQSIWIAIGIGLFIDAGLFCLLVKLFNHLLK